MGEDDVAAKLTGTDGQKLGRIQPMKSEVCHRANVQNV